MDIQLESGAMRIIVVPGADRFETTVSFRGTEERSGSVALRSLMLTGGLGAHKWVDRSLLDEAQAALPADALPLLVDEQGSVLEASRANVFAVREGVLTTPPLDGRILPGVTRMRTIELAGELGVEAREATLSRDDLLSADEVFLTGSVRGIEPVGAIDGTALPTRWKRRLRAERRNCGGLGSRRQGWIGFRAAMRFYEYEARKIVELAGIPVTKYGFCKTAEEARKAAEEIGGPTVIKSQVLSGGRMKAGGVKFADTPEEAAEHAEAILKLEINGHMPRGVLVDPKAEVKQEYYASVVWDGTAKRPLMLFSDMGGIDIEEVAETHPDHVGRGHVTNLMPIPDFEAKQAIAATGVTGSQLNRATPILAKLARLFRDYDMTLAEINPLAELTDGSFVALDAHMEMEDEAVGRQKGAAPQAPRDRRGGHPRDV